MTVSKLILAFASTVMAEEYWQCSSDVMGLDIKEDDSLKDKKDEETCSEACGALIVKAKDGGKSHGCSQLYHEEKITQKELDKDD